MHIIINDYLIDGKRHYFLEDNLEFELLNLVIQFKSIPNEIINNLNKVIQNYQIKVTQYLEGNYIKNFSKKRKVCH